MTGMELMGPSFKDVLCRMLQLGLPNLIERYQPKGAPFTPLNSRIFRNALHY